MRLPLTPEQYGFITAARRQVAEAQAQLEVLTSFLLAGSPAAKGGTPTEFIRDETGIWLVIDLPEESNGKSSSGTGERTEGALDSDPAGAEPTGSLLGPTGEGESAGAQQRPGETLRGCGSGSVRSATQ